ncbi:MAG: hypothetical protein KDB03_22360 [Planctomycetales bacterium]|nr:hypothetical protein [Planctomycetales bacterium]
MRRFLGLTVVATMVLSSWATAGEIKSGLQAGEDIGPFNVTKCAGAEDDGTPLGQNLCYRCKNGSRPQVIVFARSSGDKLVGLVRELDSMVAKHEDAQLRAFVNVLGESKDVASEDAKKLAATSKAKHIPFVVPNEFENGPEDYGINAKADLTILVATEGKVKSSHAYTSLKELEMKDVLADVAKLID